MKFIDFNGDYDLADKAENYKDVGAAFCSEGVFEDALRGHFGAEILDFVNRWIKLEGLTQSPIEKRFLHTLIKCAPDWGLPIQELHYPVTEIKPDLYLPTLGLYIFPQLSIGSYRADFVLLTNDRQRDGVIRRLVVECDGHDFHEKTKEQAARDKKRDRDFIAAGFTVLRFTGSEIHNKAEDCAEEALRFLSRWVR